MTRSDSRKPLTHPIYLKLARAILSHRFATTHHLARLTVEHYRSLRSAVRQTRRHLAGLKAAGLIVRLERRIGGWEGGSTVGIWALTTSGLKWAGESTKRGRPEQLSTGFLEHGLAVTETRVRITEYARTFPETEVAVQLEPDCWRRYVDTTGTVATLKPDLHLTITSPDYKDTYFIEVDRSTENPGRVMRKCWQYEHYRRTSAEQQRHGVFPAVIWLVPNRYRQAQLNRYLRVEQKLSKDLFKVVTPDDLYALIRDGPTEASSDS